MTTTPTNKKSEWGQQFGLSLTAFLAAWTATGYDERPAAIIGSLIAAIAGFMKPIHTTGKAEVDNSENVS
jgi:hypothetical protein